LIVNIACSTLGTLGVVFVVQYQQDLLAQVSGTAVLDYYSNFGSNSATGKDFDSGSGFRIGIQGRNSALFRVGNQGQHLG
jgi:hypothetical protein